MTARGKWGAGSVYQDAKGRWHCQRSFQRDSRGRRIRRSVTAATMEEVMVLGAALTPEVRRQQGRTRAWAVKHRTDHATAKERRSRSIGYVTLVLQEARAGSWTDEHAAAVVLAQLTPSRVRRSIFGPCAYCGTWLATTIDHVIPTIRGGPDTAENIVSACQSCNYSKRDKLLSEWQPADNMAATSGGIGRRPIDPTVSNTVCRQLQCGFDSHLRHHRPTETY